MKMILKKVILSFPALFEPKQGEFVENGVVKTTLKYSAVLLLERNDPQLVEIEKTMKALAAEKWPKGIPKSVIYTLKDGNTKDFNGYADRFYLNASCDSKRDQKPIVVDRGNSPLSPDSDKIYPGAFVDASIVFWAQDNDYGKKINCKLVGVRFNADGTRLDNVKATTAEEEFGPAIVEDEF